MSLTAKILPNYTYADYLHWKGDWELIEGIPFAMSPAPIYHQRIASRLNIIIGNELNQSGCTCEVIQPIDLKISNNTILKTDLVIVCNPTEKHFLDFPPALVIEILSPSTKLKDLNTKYELYQDFGIPYYLVVDPEAKEITLHRLDAFEKYEVANLSNGLDLIDDCTICPELAEIFE